MTARSAALSDEQKDQLIRELHAQIAIETRRIQGREAITAQESGQELARQRDARESLTFNESQNIIISNNDYSVAVGIPLGKIVWTESWDTIDDGWAGVARLNQLIENNYNESKLDNICETASVAIGQLLTN